VNDEWVVTQISYLRDNKQFHHIFIHRRGEKEIGKLAVANC